MIANFFKKSNSVNTLVISIVFTCFYCIALLNGTITFSFVSVFITLLSVGFIYFIMIKNQLAFNNSYAFLFLVFLMGIFPKTFAFNTTLVTNLILIFFLRKVYSLQSAKNTFKKLFDAGFWLGVAFILEPFSVIFIILLYMAVYFYKRLTFKMLITPIVAFCSPLFLYFTYCFWLNKTLVFYQLFNWFTNYNFSFYQNTHYRFSLIILGLFLMGSLIVKLVKYSSEKSNFKWHWLVVTFHLLLSIILVILVKNRNGTELLYPLFPSAIIIANGLALLQKKWILNTAAILFFVGTIVVNFL